MAAAPAAAAVEHDRSGKQQEGITAAQTTESAADSTVETAQQADFPNGYHFPPKHSTAHATKLGLVAFWNYFTTPIGFLVTIYALNVVAWGGMIFLLLCNAAPAMCHPSCDDINSPRRKWIEYTAQILNGLFCVTGFGLAPWRLQDLYYLMQYRLRGNHMALRRLAGIHSGWFRLPGSSQVLPAYGPTSAVEELAVAIKNSTPFPTDKMAQPPLTGVRARDTPLWKMDLVVWLMVWNTIFQAVLAGCMWGLNRYERPAWTTGLFVTLACVVGAYAGWVMFAEGQKVKRVEGVPVSDEDRARLAADREQGIYHFNNIKDEDLEGKRAKKAEKGSRKIKESSPV